jgi:hypothetical protein
VENEKFMFKCDVCSSNYQHGPGRYEGHKLNLYGGIFCCDPCWSGNWDGWSSRLEPVLLKHLSAKGLAVPARNSNGLLPRN